MRLPSFANREGSILKDPCRFRPTSCRSVFSRQPFIWPEAALQAEFKGQVFPVSQYGMLLNK